MSGLPVLTYHNVGDDPSPTSTSRAWFAETIGALKAGGLHPIDLQEWIERGRPDEPRGFAIAFDDGLRSILNVADLLADFQIPSTTFLVTDRVGQDNDWPGQPTWVPREPTLSWQEIGELAALGFRFGAHGRTHRAFDQLDPETLASELAGSREAIEQRLGKSCRLVAYPYGRSSRSVEIAASESFTAGFGTRLDYACKDQNTFALSRLDAYYFRSRPAIHAIVNDQARTGLRGRRILRALKHVAESKLPRSRREAA